MARSRDPPGDETEAAWPLGSYGAVADVAVDSWDSTGHDRGRGSNRMAALRRPARERSTGRCWLASG